MAAQDIEEGLELRAGHDVIEDEFVNDDAIGVDNSSEGKKINSRSDTSKPAAVVLAVVAGIFVVLQVGCNTGLREHHVPSALAAAATQFMVGLGVMLIISTMHKFPSCARKGGCTKLKDIPWYAYTGGILGSLYVTAAILLAPQLGLASFQLAAVAGQLISGMICDMIGLLHLSRSKPTAYRLLCAVLVLLGTGLSADFSSSKASWQTPIYLLLTALAYSVFPVQAVVNYELGQHLGTSLRAVAVNFFVGSLVLWLGVGIEYAVQNDGQIYQQPPQIEDEKTGQWWVWMGGVFGGLLVSAVTMGIPALGAVPFTLIFVSTQLICAVLADAIGAFGFDIVPLDGGRRLIGAVLAILAAAAYRLNPPQCLACINKRSCKSRALSTNNESNQ